MRLFSVDIWDTVLRRTCRPDDIKRATARYLFVMCGNRIFKDYRNSEALFRVRLDSERLIAESAIQDGFDDEYEIHDVFERWLRTVIGYADDESISMLYHYELEQEKKCSYIDPGIVHEILLYEYDRICYVSDFYSGFIDDLLLHNKFPLNFDAGYISCNYKANKRSGQLFDIVRSKECPKQWVHLGDNPYSDISVPKRKGIQAKLYTSSVSKDKSIAEILKSIPCCKHEEQLGLALGIFFYAFIADIIEKSVQSGIKCVYYFTREGEFFKRIHDSIAMNNPYGVGLPKAEILEVSRKSTFSSSLREVNIDRMMRLWNQYSIQSMTAMFQSLSVEITDFIFFLEKYKIPIEEDIVFPWKDERIRMLFSDQTFINMLETAIQEKHRAVVAYLTSKGVNQYERFAVVDVGWRGTIQDNLCYLLPEKQIIGFYVALLPFLNEQPSNSTKYGYLNASPLYMELMKCITPFEMICNSPNGSVLSYRKGKTDIFIERRVEENENRIFYAFTQHFQNGVLKAIPEICNYSDIHGLAAADLYAKATKLLYDFFNKPDKAAVHAFFTLRHNEEFGLGRFVDKQTKFRPLLFVMAAFSASKRQELADFLRQTSWVQGYLKKYHISPLIQIYKAAIKRGGKHQ